MLVPAFAIPRTKTRSPSALLAPAAGALAASALGTMLAVLCAVLAAWDRSGEAVAVGLAMVATAAAPAIAMVLYGLDAKAAVRVVAGGLATAPAIAVYYLFLARDDVAIAVAAAALAGAGAFAAKKLEKKLGIHAWWALGVAAVAGLWAIGMFCAPADVWIEMPRLWVR